MNTNQLKIFATKTCKNPHRRVLIRPIEDARVGSFHEMSAQRRAQLDVFIVDSQLTASMLAETINCIRQ